MSKKILGGQLRLYQIFYNNWGIRDGNPSSSKSEFSPTEMARWGDICSDEGRLFKGMYYLQWNKMKFQTFLGLFLSSSLFLWENLLETPRTEEAAPGNKMILWRSPAEISKPISSSSILLEAKNQITSYLPPTYFTESSMWGLRNECKINNSALASASCSGVTTSQSSVHIYPVKSAFWQAPSSPVTPQLKSSPLQVLRWKEPGTVCGAWTPELLSPFQ